MTLILDTGRMFLLKGQAHMILAVDYPNLEIMNRETGERFTVTKSELIQLFNTKRGDWD